MNLKKTVDRAAIRLSNMPNKRYYDLMEARRGRNKMENIRKNLIVGTPYDFCVKSYYRSKAIEDGRFGCSHNLDCPMKLEKIVQVKLWSSQDGYSISQCYECGYKKKQVMGENGNKREL